MKRITIFSAVFMFSLICFGFFCVYQVFADEIEYTENASSSSSLQSSEVDKDGNITYTIHYPNYNTANNRKWNSSTQKYYYVTDSINCEAIWRVFNPYTREHLYTQSYTEYSHLGSIGWTQEGVAWYSPLSSKTEVYRLFNPYTGDHLYTTSNKEYDQRGSEGWRKEGRAFYSDDSQGVEVFRAFNPYEIVGTHHYTTSKKEYDQLGPKGWVPEGLAWYGVNHTSHTWVTVEYADESKTNSIRFAYFCPEHECEFLDDAHKWSSAGGYCPADKECSKEKYVSVRLYVHKKVMCTVCGAEK